MEADKKPRAAPRKRNAGGGAPSANGGKRGSEGPDDGEPRDDPDDRPDSPRFFIVGIGASAGGLEALSALLKNVALDNMAFVVVQHLAPKHESFLPALLSRVSNIEVDVAADGTAVQPNHVYVIPPNADLAVLRGVLHVMTPPHDDGGHGSHLPVDYFFRSLAEDLGPRAVGIVLSGTGSDGTFGLKAIKEAGGITFAQDPGTAKYDGMPRNAIEAGWADFTLGPEAIADELKHISRQPHMARAKPASAPELQDGLAKLIVLIRATFGVDLSYYKPATVDRRIERRMALHKVERLADYVKFVQSNPAELRLLYKDMLISVTSFFRDRQPFEVLRDRVFPHILEHKKPGDQVRIWVPACATGEEAYSVAICLLEHLGDRASDFRLQIFGTDVDEQSIQQARRGVYPENIALDVSRQRLQRYFIKRAVAEYQVSRRVRDMVVFSTQNVTKDAPFSRLDLVSCRNLLIYLRPAVQKKVLHILHYALAPGGFLLLGNSETVGDSTDYFSLVDRKNKLYTRRNMATMAGVEFGLGGKEAEAPPAIQPSSGQRAASNLSSLAERKILELYGPPGVVINDDLDVVHVRGRTGPYLEPMPGAPSFNVLRLARTDLHAELRRAIHEAKTSGERARVECRLAIDGKARMVEIEVVPVVEPESKARCFLVLFHEPEPARLLPPPAPAGPGSANPEDQRFQELERELFVTKEYLQSTIEELESANEELKSSNEELQSSNEELQSTNEELETSKEELQSSNEELTTVNDELQSRMGELQQTNDDLHNILGAIGEAVIIVDLDGRIRRFNQLAERLFNLVAGDTGRSVSMINSFLTGRRIDELVAQVVERLTPVEVSVAASDKTPHTLRVSPYRTLDHSIKGAVVALTPRVPVRGKTAVTAPRKRTAAGPAKTGRPPARRRNREVHGRRKPRGPA